MVSETPNKGFSLIELLVVISVMLSLTGLAISNYSSFTDTQKVKQAGKTLKNSLRFIQTRSASGLKPTDCTTLISYRITFTAATYSYQPLCTNGLVGTAQTFTLPNNTTFTNAPTMVDFQVLNGGSSLSDFDITLSSGAKNYTISVKSNGNIEDSGFSQSSPYP